VIAFARHVVTLTRMLVMGAGAAMVLCIATVVSVQFGFWFMTRTWSPLPVSRLMELADITVSRRYLPASVEPYQGGQTDGRPLLEGLLDLPAVIVLLVGLTVLALCYAALNSLDKRLAGSET